MMEEKKREGELREIRLYGKVGRGGEPESSRGVEKVKNKRR